MYHGIFEFEWVIKNDSDESVVSLRYVGSGSVSEPKVCIYILMTSALVKIEPGGRCVIYPLV